MGEFRMPSLGADMDRGTIVEWRVAPGDTVRRGDIVAVIDTDKSDIEVEVFESGTVDELLVPVGTEVAVGTPLARISPTPDGTAPPPPPAATPPGPPAAHRTTHVVSPLVRHRAEELGIDPAGVAGTGPGGAVTRDDIERVAGAAPTTSPPAAAPAAREGGRPVPSSPYARRLAAAAGVDLDTLVGTGPGGAVVAADVERARPAQGGEAGASAGPPPGDQAVSARSPDRRQSIRQAVARLMSRSKRDIPHYYLSTTIDLAPATAWLSEVNATRSATTRVLPAALLLEATARAAAQVPEMNGHWRDDAFVPADRVDLGVAVSLRGGGLVAPVITRADERSVDELMAALRDLVTRARAGSLTSSEMADPTLTVTNLGEQGVEAVFGVIYPPQVALVGFGRIVERPWAIDGAVGVHPCVTATLSADHRASDGHRGAAFLRIIDRLLAEPQSL